jgi:hypothetical protein
VGPAQVTIAETGAGDLKQAEIIRTEFDTKFTSDDHDLDNTGCGVSSPGDG